MEKMITVINDNLTSVITGIREHKEDLQQTLERIKNNMSAKVKEANHYKDEVENSRVIISTLEEEITNLETDLAELNHKFNSKDFKEILNAGNKEINAKIVEKRNLISEQGQKIIDLTDKAKTLKEELISLKEKRKTTEENLDKTLVLERYYSLRINEVIDYSIANSKDLDSYLKEIPQEDLDVSEEYTDVDINQVIDGAVFEEIDEISSSEPDEELLASVLANPEAIEITPIEEVIAEDLPEIEEEPIKEIDEYEFPLTGKLEDMITEAKSIIARNASLVNVENISDATEISADDMVSALQDEVNEEDLNRKFPNGEIGKDKVQAAIDFDDVDAKPFEMKPTVNEIQNSITFDDITEPVVFEEETPEVETEEVVEENVTDAVDFSVEDAIDFGSKDESPVTEDFIEIIGSDLEKVNEETDELEDDEDTIDIFIDEDEEDKPFNSNLIVDLDGNVIKENEKEEESAREIHERLHTDSMSEGVVPEEVSVMDVIKDEPMADLDQIENYDTEEVISDRINQGYEEIAAAVQNEINNITVDDENVIDSNSFLGIEEADFDTELEAAGLDKNLFEQDDLILLQTGFDKENAIRILDVMNKYNLDVNKIYKNVRLLMYFSPENLDKLITLLITSGASNKDVDMLFDCFDRVNLSKFEQEIMTSSDPVLTQMLFDSLPVESNEVIGDVLGLTIQEVNILKKNAKDDDYKIMNMFPNIVKANYDELKKLNIENLNECITKHPHRFTLVPSKFQDILDKYDTDDLIRCINKNCAVIDKL